MEAAAGASPAIVIIGAGALGSAVGTVLSRKGFSLALWDKDPGRPTLGKTLNEIVPSAKILLFCVPSFAVRSVAEAAAPFMRTGALVVCFSKGLEEKTRKTMDQVLDEVLPKRVSFALVGGPMLAGEMSAGSVSIAKVASKDPTALVTVQTLFSSTNVRVSTTNDVHGVALSSVLKNVYAVALGIAEGLGMSTNEKGWLVSKAAREMVGIGALLGVQEETLMGSAGLADLIATGSSSASRNHQSGIELSQGIAPEIRGEGIFSLTPMLALIGSENRIRFPLLDVIAQIALEHARPKETFDEYIQLNL